MKLTLKTPYLFFPNFEEELPNFTVITGKNGSGKTNLLKGIKSKTIINDITSNDALITLLNSNSFNITEDSLTIHSAGGHYEIYQMYLGKTTNTYQDEREKVPLKKIVDIVAKMSGKSRDQLNESDFVKFTPVNITNIRGGIYNLDFAWNCLEYVNKLNKNLYNRFLNTTMGRKDISFLNDEEFEEIIGIAPWDSVNKIFDSMQIEYEIETSEISDLDNFRIFFVHKTSREKMVFSSLSSGEQIFVLTVLSILNFNTNFQIPKILLMDECDAWLHPSMIKDFLKVIEEVFVNQKNIKVILTTHNPTTVALAPENSIYIMTRSEQIITKTTKDTALKILTEGVPSFSVNYENRRQVFVESPNDVSFYDRLYRILSSKLNPEISLYFIASGDVQKNESGLGKNSCDIVKEITELMRGYHNNFIWGIIDWDRKTTKPACEYVRVLGWQQRHSIENYLFDPLLVAALLLREKYINREELKIEASESYVDFKIFSNERLQEIVDYILQRLHPHLTDKDALSDEGSSEAYLINGKKISLPNWFLLHQGHKLEEAYIKAFDKLKNSKRNKEELLKLEIIDKVIDDVPEILSVDILELLKDLQD